MADMTITQDKNPIPAGFKRTEIGVIPEDWTYDSLERVCPPGKKYGIVDGPFGSNLKTEHYKKSGIPIISSGFVTTGQFLADEYIFVDEEKFRQEKRSAVAPGDIVMAKIGARCGASAILPIKHEIGILSGNALKITVNENKHETYFIWQFLWDLYSKGKFEDITAVGAQPAISMPHLKKLLIPLPTKSEQTAIANVLSDTDALITELEQLITKKEAIKTATMQQLLTGRTRLSQFSKHSDGTPKGFTSSELGLIPEDWILSPMSQMGHVLRGVSYNGSRDLFPHDTDDSVRLFRSNNIYNSKIDLANLQYVNKNRVAYHQLMNSGDILICMANGSKNLVGKAAIYNIEESHKYTFGAFMGVFRTFPEVESLYAFYLLTSDRCRSYIDLALAGSSINNLKPSDIEQFTFALPNYEEQKAIVAILSDMDAELEVLEQKLSKVRDIKQGMMQQLLTGRIRLTLDHQP
ncbi:restriction endonuclease subunit S [Enterobacter roggenkampii]|uniref:restriction endonuclease subunit S n=1 Tax=Enterobacter roggenkampii TaxID=1812935 RepID=UPI001F397056|nr:restriction endonuclease subunit S [Enterobacter roggenkampii]